MRVVLLSVATLLVLGCKAPQVTDTPSPLPKALYSEAADSTWMEGLLLWRSYVDQPLVRSLDSNTGKTTSEYEGEKIMIMSNECSYLINEFHHRFLVISTFDIKENKGASGLAQIKRKQLLIIDPKTRKRKLATFPKPIYLTVDETFSHPKSKDPDLYFRQEINLEKNFILISNPITLAKKVALSDAEAVITCN